MDSKTKEILQKFSKNIIRLNDVKVLKKQINQVKDAIKTTLFNTKDLEEKIKKARDAKSLYSKAGIPGDLQNRIDKIERIVKELGLETPLEISSAKKVIQEFNSVIKKYSNY